MAQMEWADRPSTADMREQYGAVVDLARRATASGGLAGLASRLAEAGERLAAHADSLSDSEAATLVRFSVYHEGHRLIAGQTSFHLPLHRRHLEALTSQS